MTKKLLWWTSEREAQLRTLAESGLTAALIAEIMGTTDGAIYGRARKLEIKFASAECQALAAFLKEGGRLLREDCGGAVGVRWGRAHRSGPSFSADICEALLSNGRIKAAARSDHVYCAA